MTVEQYTGTPGSGKSYHVLEVIVKALEKGKHVIANFPLNFTPSMVKKGYSDRFMFIPDRHLMGAEGVIRLYRESLKVLYENENTIEYQFFGEESQCLVVIDESGNYYPPERSSSPEQILWQKFMTMHRKLGYDIILVSQIDKQVNRTIRGCVEYEVKHRKANRVFPFKYLPFTIFMYITYWKQTRERLGSESSIFVKRFSELYDTHMLFGMIEDDVDNLGISAKEELDHNFEFGNCSPEYEHGHSPEVITGDNDQEEIERESVEHIEFWENGANQNDLYED